MGILSGELSFADALDSIQAEPCKMPKQREFMLSDKSYTAFIGGEGSGKTAAIITDLIVNCAAEAHGFTLVGRLNMPALESSTMRSFLEMVAPEYGAWAETKKTFTFSNRHEVVFKHLDITDPKIVGHIKSMNLSRAYVDEASEVSEEIFWTIAGRCRRRSRIAVSMIKLASNPAGHDWMWRTFFDPDRRERLKEITKGITASSMENPFLPEDYLENRKSLYPPDWADRFIYGHFSDFSDLVYKEYSEPTHVWNDSLHWDIFQGRNLPPESWPIIVGMDIGSDIDPWAIPIIAVAPNGMLFQFAEVYGNSLLIRQIAEMMREKLRGLPIDGLAYDWANRQAALELGEYNISGTPAMKEVMPGIFKTAQYFHIDPRLTHPFNPKAIGAPRYYIAQSCYNTRKELSAYKWEKDRSGKATGDPSHENSHSPDAIRYAIHTFRPLPEKLPIPKMWQNPKLDALSREYWRDYEKYREKHDRMEHFKPQTHVPKTVQEWQAVARANPLRFMKPRSVTWARGSQFSRIGRS